MSLLVSITKSPGSVDVAELTKNFESQGGTIGRGAENTWILEDPERYLSTCHCRISSENDQYFLTDLSTNGTFYNGSPNPIGKGSKQALNDGDNFIIGDYEFTVSSSAHQSSEFSSGPFAENDFASPFPGSDGFAQDSGSSNDPFASAHVSASDSLFTDSPAETDPLAALDKAQGKQEINIADPFAPTPSSDPFSGPSFSDRADPVNQQISWPDATPEQVVENADAIPDDWDDDFNVPASPPPPGSPVQSIPLSTPSVPPESAQGSVQKTPPQADSSGSLQQNDQIQNVRVTPSNQQQDAVAQENAKLHAELAMLKQQVSAQQLPGNADTTVDTSLIDSLGFQKYHLNDAEIVKINQLAGEVMKEMVRGVMQILGSRGSIKNEFRMHVTTIQPVENNPLKFSANVEDALENMFVKKGNAYKKPVEAVQESFESIAEHQVAILAGIKSAFSGVIERFDPALLEERFSKQNTGGFIPGSHKAKNWDLYNEYFNELAADIDNSFHYLFGDDFVRAYEDQLQKMSIAKKAMKSTTGK